MKESLNATENYFNNLYNFKNVEKFIVFKFNFLQTFFKFDKY